MRVILLLTIALFFIVLIASCDKSSDKVTNNPPAENLLCGDANGDGILNIFDATAMINYAFMGDTLSDTSAAETDNIEGVTANDALCLSAYLYLDGDPPICSHDMPDTVLPVSDDTIFVSGRTVPPGVENWEVQISLRVTNDIQALAFPFHYDCPDSSIVCDSIVYQIHKINTATAKPAFPEYLFDIIKIDTLNQIGLIFRGEETSGLMISLASIWFSLTPSVDSQTITIDTTTYPPSNYLLLSRFEAPATIASVPVIVYE